MDKDNSTAMQLYFEFNGTKYAVDQKCCTLDFSAHKSKDGAAKACIEITDNNGRVCLDLRKEN